MTTSHAEFVKGYHAGQIALAFDAPQGYLFAALQSHDWEWTFTGFLNVFLAAPAISLLFLILTFVLHDPWLLVGVPAAFLGTAAGAPNHDKYTKRISLIFIAVTLAGLPYCWFVFGWRSPVFLILCAFFIPLAVNVTYHAVCRRAFLRLLLTREDFYEDAIQRNLIALEERVNA